MALVLKTSTSEESLVQNNEPLTDSTQPLTTRTTVLNMRTNEMGLHKFPLFVCSDVAIPQSNYSTMPRTAQPSPRNDSNSLKWVVNPGKSPAPLPSCPLFPSSVFSEAAHFTHHSLFQLENFRSLCHAQCLESIWILVIHLAPRLGPRRH